MAAKPKKRRREMTTVKMGEREIDNGNHLLSTPHL
jgi:hypothetical protein